MRSEIEQKVADLLTSGDPDARRQAAEELAESNELATITALRVALQDTSKGVRDAAARSLIAIGGSTVARSIARYIADTDIVTRNLASKLLIRMGEVSIPAILPFLRDQDKDVRKFVVDILGEIESVDSVYHLLPLLNDPDPNVIVSTLEALGNIGSVESLGPICKAFDAYPFARPSAADALGRIGDTSVGDYLLEKFLKAKNDVSTDPVVLCAVIEALGSVGSARAADALTRQLDVAQGKLFHILIHAIVQITERSQGVLEFPESVRGDMLAALGDDNEGIRLSAAKGLVQFDDAAVTRALVLALGSSEEFDFFLISVLLGRREAFREAVEVLEEEHGRRVGQVVLLLGKLAYEFVKRFSEHQSYEVTNLLLSRAFDAVLTKWAEADHETRAIFVDTMFRLTGDRAVACISEIAADPDPWLRVHIIELLAEIRDRRAIDVVMTFLEDEDEMVREAAVSMLQARGMQAEVVQFTEFS